MVSMSILLLLKIIVIVLITRFTRRAVLLNGIGLIFGHINPHSLFGEHVILIFIGQKVGLVLLNQGQLLNWKCFLRLWSSYFYTLSILLTNFCWVEAGLYRFVSRKGLTG